MVKPVQFNATLVMMSVTLSFLGCADDSTRINLNSNQVTNVQLKFADGFTDANSFRTAKILISLAPQDTTILSEFSQGLQTSSQKKCNGQAQLQATDILQMKQLIQQLQICQYAHTCTAIDSGFSGMIIADLSYQSRSGSNDRRIDRTDLGNGCPQGSEFYLCGNNPEPLYTFTSSKVSVDHPDQCPAGYQNWF